MEVQAIQTVECAVCSTRVPLGDPTTCPVCRVPIATPPKTTTSGPKSNMPGLLAALAAVVALGVGALWMRHADSEEERQERALAAARQADEAARSAAHAVVVDSAHAHRSNAQWIPLNDDCAKLGDEAGTPDELREACISASLIAQAKKKLDAATVATKKQTFDGLEESTDLLSDVDAALAGPTSNGISLAKQLAAESAILARENQRLRKTASIARAIEAKAAKDAADEASWKAGCRKWRDGFHRCFASCREVVGALAGVVNRDAALTGAEEVQQAEVDEGMAACCRKCMSDGGFDPTDRQGCRFNN